MQEWSKIRPIVEKVLKQQRFKNTAQYRGAPCFLTNYQIAVLVDKIDPTLKGTLPIGGEGMGTNNFAQQIASRLAEEVNNKGAFDGKLEMQLFSLAGLDSFTFAGGNKPSANEFTMFLCK